MEQFDENQNIVHRTDNWENQPALPVNDHFTRLVWIDPQSPILQRKGITKQETDQEGEEKAKDVVTEEYDSETSWDEEDARTADEQENRDSPMDGNHIKRKSSFNNSMKKVEDLSFERKCVHCRWESEILK